MTANPFDLSPSAPAPTALWGNRFILALVATLVLGGLLAVAIDVLLQYLSSPPLGTEESTDKGDIFLPRYNAYFFLGLAANRLINLLVIGLSAWLMVGHLFERRGEIGYRRPRRLLLSLFAISMGLTLIHYLVMGYVWAYSYELAIDLGGTLAQEGAFIRFVASAGSVLQWALAAPFAIWLTLRLFRNDALAGPLHQVKRSEAAWLAALCTGLATLTVLRRFAKPFEFLGDLATFASFYGIGIAVTLAAFVGTRMALPAQLNGLRPLSLLTASLVNVASLTLLIGGAAMLLMLITYGRPPFNSWLLGLGIVSLPLCTFMQLFCIRVIYRPLPP